MEFTKRLLLAGAFPPSLTNSVHRAWNSFSTLLCSKNTVSASSADFRRNLWWIQLGHFLRFRFWEGPKSISSNDKLLKSQYYRPSCNTNSGCILTVTRTVNWTGLAFGLNFKEIEERIREAPSAAPFFVYILLPSIPFFTHNLKVFFCISLICCAMWEAQWLPQFEFSCATKKQKDLSSYNLSEGKNPRWGCSNILGCIPLTTKMHPLVFFVRMSPTELSLT